MLSGSEIKIKNKGCEPGEEKDVGNALRGVGSEEASIRPHARDQVTLGSRQLFSEQALLSSTGKGTEKLPDRHVVTAPAALSPP